MINLFVKQPDTINTSILVTSNGIHIQTKAFTKLTIHFVKKKNKINKKTFPSNILRAGTYVCVDLHIVRLFFILVIPAYVWPAVKLFK